MFVQHLLAILFHLLYESFDINLMIESLLPDNMKMHVTLEEIRMRTNLTIRSISISPFPKDYKVKVH